MVKANEESEQPEAPTRKHSLHRGLLILTVCGLAIVGCSASFINEKVGLSDLVTKKEQRAQELLRPPSEERACQELPNSIEAYIEEVHQDIEHKSLRAWRSNDGRWSFPHLDSTLLNSAFGNKKIALIGDSTLFIMLQNLNVMLNHTEGETQYGNWSDTMTLQEWWWANHKDSTERGNYLGWMDLNKDEHWVATAGSGHAMKYEHIGAEVMWTGYHGPNGHDSCKFEEQVWPNIRRQRPDVLVANWGLHMFHYGDVVYQPLCKVHQFLHYEEWLDMVLNVAKEVGTRVLLFKTTNLICIEKQGLNMQEALVPFYNNTQAFLDACVARLKREQNPQTAKFIDPNINNSNGYTFTEDEMYKYCFEATAGNERIRMLNDRMRQFVEKTKQDPSNRHLRIEMFNDHDLESCEYSNDGVHFIVPQIARIKLLSQMIKCLWTAEENITPSVSKSMWGKKHDRRPKVT